MADLPRRTPYVITHEGLSGVDHLEQVRRLLAAGVRLVQLRDKGARAPEALEPMIRACAQACHARGATLIVNDDPRLAVLGGADGVHVGQDDMSPSEVRSIVGPDRIVGLSTHNREQFERALAEPVDYIAVGPVFGTTTKENPDPATGLELVRHAAARLQRDRRALVVIGGVDATNLRSVLVAAPGAVPAVIGCVWSAPRPADAIRRLRIILEEHGSPATGQ
jgi:thiamine-phosphate pyrophosphorylase